MNESQKQKQPEKSRIQCLVFFWELLDLQYLP